MRKGTAIILIITLVAGMAVIGYFLINSRRELMSDPYKAISPGVSFIIESPDLQSFINSVTSGKGLSGETDRIKEFGTFSIKTRYLADLLNKSGIKKLVENNASLIGLFYNKDKGLEPLLSVTSPAEIKFRHLKAVFRSAGIDQAGEKEIQGNPVLFIPYEIEGQKDTVFITISSGLLLCGTSEEVLTGAINRAGLDTDVRDAPGFSKIHQAAGKNTDKVFVLFRNLGPLMKPALEDNGAGLTEKITKLAGCLEGDIYLDEKSLVIAGYAETSDTTDLLYRFKNATAGVLNTSKVLPSSTVLFETFITPGLKVSDGLLKNPSPTAVFAAGMSKYLGDEITGAYLDLQGNSVNENRLIIYELKDRVFAENTFLEAFRQNPDRHSISWFRPDDQINIPVYSTTFNGFSSLLHPVFTSGIKDSCFVFYDNFLITGSSFRTISSFLYDNILNKTLVNDIFYREFESSLPSVASYFMFCVPSGITDYISPVLNRELKDLIAKNKPSLERVQALGVQLISSNDMIYSTISVRFTEEMREKSKTEWETKLDTAASIKPFFFTNHTTGAREIFVQDLKNNAYLINSAGRVLWKVPLNEQITGQVYSIDYFRNGKFQLLFAGKNFLHLIDRNGNYVERYPVRLRSPSASPLALFDYDNNRDYRLLIAGEDKAVYAYDKSGNTVKGWKLFKTNGIVNSEISWFRVSGKDFLVVSDEKSVYLLDRTGAVRLRLREPVVKARYSAVRLSTGSEQSIVCTAPDGTVQHINFDGSVTRFQLKPFTVDHRFDFFDIDGDGFGEYIFIDKGMLYLYDHNRVEMFTKEFGSSGLGGPICFTFSSGNREIGVFDVDKKLIYLINRDGMVMKNFPLRGASMFSIGKMSDDKGWNLIVGGTDNFLYNYNLNTGF